MWSNYPFKPLADKIGIENMDGVKLITTKELHDIYTGGDEIPEAPSNIIEVLWALFNNSREMALRLHVHANEWERTIKVDIGDTSSTDFNMTEEQKKTLYTQGQIAVDEYLLSLCP